MILGTWLEGKSIPSQADDEKWPGNACSVNRFGANQGNRNFGMLDLSANLMLYTRFCSIWPFTLNSPNREPTTVMSLVRMH